MSQFDITKIEVNNAYNVVNSGDVTITTGYQIVWNSTDSWVDGPTGSVMPVSLQSPASYGLITYGINVYGTANFTEDWRGAQYVLAGYLDQRLVFQSENIDVPSTGTTVDVEGCWLVIPDFRSRLVDVPFRYGGDFYWAIWLYKDSNFSDYMLFSSSTRLEICWVRASCPQGPKTVTSSTDKTHVNMQPGYPIILMRLFAPPPCELPDYQNDDVPNFIKRAIITSIWCSCAGYPQYDVYGGSSSYGMSNFGGSFKLKDWVKATFPRCNCYDVAGISQLACSLLIDEDRDELVDSHWVYQTPNGFINPGPLIRWVQNQGDHLRCNSPFWGWIGGLPYVDPDDPNRTSFSNHAWVEVTVGGSTGVLDACHALRAIPPVPPCGEYSRQNYLEITLDQSKTHGNATARTAMNDGNCYLNPDYQLDRIGVTDWGQPVFSSPRAMLPEQLANEIAALVERGAAPTPIEPRFNRVDLSPSTIKDAICPDFNLVSTSTTLASGIVRMVAKFQRNDDSATLIVSLHIFDNTAERPMDALITNLASIPARPLEAVVRTDEPHLGSYSFHTATNTVWIRGNIFARVDHFTKGGVDRSRPHTRYAAQLDAHLVNGPIAAPPPDLELELDLTEVPSPAERGQPFHIRLETPRESLASVMSISDNIDVIVPRGPPQSDGGLVFYPQVAGEANITVLAAVAGSMLPIQRSVNVHVGGLTVNELAAALEQERAAAIRDPREIKIAPPFPGT